MNKKIILFLVMCCLISMSGCSKEEIVDHYNQVLQVAGDNGLTKDKELQGKRKLGTDSYVGTYKADYDGFSGEEVLFGGTALARDAGNKIEIACDTDITDGTLKLILKTGADDPKILCDTLQSYSDTIELPSASNYIVVEAENFTGSFSLTIQ